MNFRVITNRFPEALLRSMRLYPTISREVDTDVRGPFAIVGNGRVWAVANLVSITPMGPLKKTQSYIWKFDGLQELTEVVECANYSAPAMFMNGEKLQPQFLQSGAQVKLNELLERMADTRDYDFGPYGDATTPGFIKRSEPEPVGSDGKCTMCDEPCGTDYNLSMCPDQYPQDEPEENEEYWATFLVCPECWEHHKLMLPQNVDEEVEPAAAAQITTLSMTLEAKPPAPEKPKPPKPPKPRKKATSVETFQANKKGQLAMF